jgi:RNA binding exosome subunit
MKYFHNVAVRVFSKEDEDCEKIKSNLIKLFPFDLTKEKLRVKESSAVGFEERRIRIFEVFLEKERLINGFMENILNNLKKEQVELLISQADSRLDNDLYFFIRIDKRKLIDEKRFWITDKGSCYHIRAKVAAYPTVREKALEVMRIFLEKFINKQG